MTLATPQLSRRRFLKLAGAAGLVAVPSFVGYDLVHDAAGEFPPSLSPYEATNGLEQSPFSPTTSGPLLLLLNERTDNPFGLYLGELLRAEGTNCFQVARLSAVDLAALQRFDIVVLTEGTLDSAQAQLIEAYVARGGRLVCMRPDPRLAPLLGIEHASGSTSEGYIQVNSEHPIGQGIATETLQFHGTADHYRVAGAQVIAWLASDAETPTDYPAVTYHQYGQGQAVAWAYDLARSVAYTRQGNPAWANQERDEFEWVRPSDMFKGWLDLDRLAIPQADEQQRLLVNALSALSQEARPLPRIWYFPGAAEAMLVATSDSHANPASAIAEVLARVEERGGHISVYYAPPCRTLWYRAARRARFWACELPLIGETLSKRFASPTPSDVRDWRAGGHEFAPHPYVGPNSIAPGLEPGWRRYWQEFTGLGYGPVPPTARTHCIMWTGWVETARLQASYGIRMNLDYYHAGPAFRKETGEWVYGHFIGSGLPVKFVDQQGRILNIYQQPTQLADDHLLDLHWDLDWVPQVTLPAEDAVKVSRQLLQASLEGHYSAIGAIFHSDPFEVGGKSAAEESRFIEGTLDYAAAQGIPIWSAEEWLHFTEARHDSSFHDLLWHPSAQRLTFSLAAAPDPDIELGIMIPLQHGETRLTVVAVDGSAVKHGERLVGGVHYGWVPVEAGPHELVVTYV